VRPSPTTAVPGSGGEAERRQLTIMFCDLVGSTPLTTRFDPEDLSEIVGAYHRCVTNTVGRFGGFVAKYMGDGVLVYFGYPEAHEDVLSGRPAPGSRSSTRSVGSPRPSR
jgi:class 3 adenylate cyclase